MMELIMGWKLDIVLDINISTDPGGSAPCKRCSFVLSTDLNKTCMAATLRLQVQVGPQEEDLGEVDEMPKELDSQALVGRVEK